MEVKIFKNIGTFFLAGWEKVSPILFLSIFLVIFFSLSGCNYNKHPSLTSCLEDEEKKDLEYLLRWLIFENHGAFVLFGSKPLCEACVINTDETEVDELEHQKLLASMSSEEREEYEKALKILEEKRKKLEKKEKVIFARNPYKGWLALEKVINKSNMKKYILVANHEGLYGGGHNCTLILANIQTVALVLAENYPIFREISEIDFHPLEMALELQNPHSAFWNRVFKIDNHLTKGLIFGFGRKNSFFWDWKLNHLSKTSSLHLSEKAISYLKNIPSNPSTPRVEIGKGGPSNFTVPIFGTVEGDEVVRLYEKEKKEIEKIFRGKDFVEIVLERLVS